MRSFIAVLLYIAVLCAPAIIVRADFTCQDQWKNASKDNTFGITDENDGKTCNMLKKYQDDPGIFVLPAIAILCFVFNLLIFPVFWCCRQICGCCGSNKQRPGHCCCGGQEWDDKSDAEREAQYSDSRRYCVKGCMFITVVLSAGLFILLLVGATNLVSGYNQFFDGVLGIADYADDQLANIKNRTTITDVNGTEKLIPGLNSSMFDDSADAINNVRKDLNEYRSDGDQYVLLSTKVTMGIGALPVVLLGIGALFALFNIKTCCPACFTCIYFFFITIYSLVAFVMLIVGIVFTDFCDEVDLHHARAPGVIQWYLIPMCNDTLDFGSINKFVEDAERDNSIKGCEELLKICSPGSEIDLSNLDKVYECNITNATTDCTNLESFSTIFLATKPKSDPRLDQLNRSPCLPGASCTMQDCPQNCVIPSMAETARTVIDYLDFADRAISAFRDFVAPMFNCDELTDIALNAFKKCSNTANGMLFIGYSCLGYTILFIVGIVLLFLGQKLFFSPSTQVPGEAGEPTEILSPVGPEGGETRNETEMQNLPGTVPQYGYYENEEAPVNNEKKDVWQGGDGDEQQEQEIGEANAQESGAGNDGAAHNPLEGQADADWENEL